MKRSELEVGNVVRLRSSGPLMTVRRINQQENLVWCDWFDTDGTFHCEVPFDMYTIARVSLEFING